jgi:hypothetical protein
MDGFSLWHWLILLLIELLWVTPLWRLLRRIGYSPAWALIAFIPPLWLVLLWVLAFAQWKIADAGEEPLVGERS